MIRSPMKGGIRTPSSCLSTYRNIFSVYANNVKEKIDKVCGFILKVILRLFGMR